MNTKVGIEGARPTTEAVPPDDPNPASTRGSGRRVWVSPVVSSLPRLSELTLQSGSPIPGGGGTGGGGSTVIP